jgi:hypothetical protein
MNTPIGRSAALLFCYLITQSASAALLDRWVASDLQGLDDGDAVGAWSSAGNRVASAALGDEPRLRKNATPTGEPTIQFLHNRLTTSSSPTAGLSAFSMAVVFRVDEPGVDEGSGWSTKSGIVDANQSGAGNDWGFVVRETGYIAFGTGTSGGSDQTVYLDDQPTYPSVVDGKYHVAVATWGGGSQTLYMDGLPGKTQTGVSTVTRGNVGMSFGGMNSGEMTRRFAGELAEVRFYSTTLGSAEVGSLISELSAVYISSPRPTILSFVASANQVLRGQPVTLSWVVTNASTISIDQGVGTFSSPAGSVQVLPLASTLFTLVASNSAGMRTAQLSVAVDPGIPSAGAQNLSVIKDTARLITLTGTDPQGSAITFSVVQLPQHGTLSGQTPNLVYVPAPGYVGSDFFTFTVNDGTYDSAPATVQLYVDEAAVAPHGIFLSGSKVDADAVEGAFLLGLRAVDANRFDVHQFSLVPGAGDVNNGSFRISGNRLLAGSGFPVNTGTALSIRIRATDSTGLFTERILELKAETSPVGVVINEIHYNPADNTIPEEFVELFNPGTKGVDLSGWRLRGAVEFDFAQNTSIGSGGYLVVASAPNTISNRYSVAALGPWTGNLSSDGEKLTLRNAADEVEDVVDYRAEFPWPIAADGRGASMELVNAILDNDLGSSWASSLNPLQPSPGAVNRVAVTNAAPNIRQVAHSPKQPASTNAVTITAKVTDPQGVASVELKYQVVAPGRFIPSYVPLTTSELNATPNARPAVNPAFEAVTNWVTLQMHDDGLDGDITAGDDIYTVVLPARANRTLVRYRIQCTDIFGASRRAPFEDDSSLNFAYFVYDGVPTYAGVSSSDLERLPVYFLITRSQDFDVCTAYNSSYQLPQFSGSVANEARFVFNWPGAFVYDGEVYDHIRYRLRGANGRYQNGKRSFRFRFNDGRAFQAKDEFGQPYPRKWTSLNTAKGQSNRLTLTYSLNEYLNYLLLHMVGVPSPGSHYFHWRIVRGTSEAPDNYTGDFYGISWTQEEYDADFLEAHNLPKGNLYKLINAQRSTDAYVDMQQQQRYQGRFAVTNGGDAVRIQNQLVNPNSSQTDAWLLENVNYTNWYAYDAILEAVRNYDTWPSANKNAAWYFDTNYTAANGYCGRFWTLPWDWTDTWGPTWNAGQDLAWNGIFGATSSLHPNMQQDYRNTVREIRELLFQPDQINPLIDAIAARLAPVAPADLVRWANCTPAGSSYSSLGSAGPGLSAGLAGYVQDLKRFMFEGGTYSWWIDRQTVSAGGWVTRLDSLAADSSIPSQPSLSYVGAAGFPANSVILQSSAFADPQGSSSFAGMQWRLAEVQDTNKAAADARAIPAMEWNPVWLSGTLTTWSNRITIPMGYLQTNALYRARVRHLDNTGRWSKWSPPVQFQVGPADVTADWREGLRFSEIMYHPLAWGGFAGDDLEFLELQNMGAKPLDMGGLTFTAGISFTFTNGTLLQPGEFILLGRNATALLAKYPGITVGGIYSGKLDNAGETIALSLPSGADVLSVTYGTRAPWPVTPDGYGFSLVLDDANAGTYRASSLAGGSPGVVDQASSIPGIVVSEVLANSVPPALDRIELHNPTTNQVDLAGWFLTDDADNPQKYRIPEGTRLTPGGYYALDETQFGFSLSSLGEEVYLFSGNAASDLTGYSHGFAFAGTLEGQSIGRYINSAGEERFPAQIEQTFGTNNLGPLAGSVVISEINYAPTGTAAFVELRNITGSALPLFDSANPTNTWQVNGLSFTFPMNVQIPANGFVLLVASSPAAFRAAHGIPAEVQIYQFAGQLQTNGEALELLSPATPSASGVPYCVVDRVRYGAGTPWPDIMGSGFSLQRIDPMNYGDDPINWGAALPTPGTSLPVPVPAIVVRAQFNSGSGSLTLSFEAEANRTYKVQYKDRLEEPAWSLLQIVPVLPAARTEVIRDLGNSGARFYRVITPGL